MELAYGTASKLHITLIHPENVHIPLAASLSTAPCVSPFFLIALRYLLDAPVPGSAPFPASGSTWSATAHAQKYPSSLRRCYSVKKEANGITRLSRI